MAGFFDKQISTTSWYLLMHLGFLFVCNQNKHGSQNRKKEKKKELSLLFFVVGAKLNEKEMDILKSKVSKNRSIWNAS